MLGGKGNFGYNAASGQYTGMSAPPSSPPVRPAPITYAVEAFGQTEVLELPFVIAVIGRFRADSDAIDFLDHWLQGHVEQEQPAGPRDRALAEAWLEHTPARPGLGYLETRVHLRPRVGGNAWPSLLVFEALFPSSRP